MSPSTSLIQFTGPNNGEVASPAFLLASLLGRNNQSRVVLNDIFLQENILMCCKSSLSQLILFSGLETNGYQRHQFVWEAGLFKIYVNDRVQSDIRSLLKFGIDRAFSK